jgi:hypothetical protein
MAEALNARAASFVVLQELLEGLTDDAREEIGVALISDLNLTFGSGAAHTLYPVRAVFGHPEQWEGLPSILRSRVSEADTRGLLVDIDH